MDPSTLNRFVGDLWDGEIVPQLTEYIRIPNKSPMFDAQWAEHGHMDRAVALIRRLTEGRTLVIVEHDMSVVFGLADRISVLVYGHIIASGTPEEIRNNPKVKEAYLGEEAG